MIVIVTMIMIMIVIGITIVKMIMIMIGVKIVAIVDLNMKNTYANVTVSAKNVDVEKNTTANNCM